MKKNCKKADYIYVERSPGTRTHLYLEHHVVAQKNVIRICQLVKETTEMKQWRLRILDKKLLCVIKKFWCSDTIVTGNERITSEWDMPNELFQIKKQIFLQGIKDILMQFCIEKKYPKYTLRRRSFLLVLNSLAWTYKEVQNVLWEVQQRYEDIYIVPNGCAFSMEEISDYFLEECGVVLHILEENIAKQMCFHTIFFLLEHCENMEKDYLFQNQYRLVEWEENQFQSLLFVALNDTINDSMRRNR